MAQGATDFGVTLHEMTDEIDAGPIIEICRFEIAPDASRLEVLDQAERYAVQLFASLVRHCAFHDSSLPRSTETWSGKRTTARDYECLVRRRQDLKVPDEDSLIQALRA